MNNSNELQHFGVLGMKWGVRRNQKSSASNTRGSTNSKNTVHEDYTKAHSKKRVKQMSDSELRSRNNRLQMERQYSTLTKKTHKGSKVVKSLIATAGTIAAAESAYKTYKGVANKAIDALGDYVMSDLKKGLAKDFLEREFKNFV